MAPVKVSMDNLQRIAVRTKSLAVYDKFPPKQKKELLEPLRDNLVQVKWVQLAQKVSQLWETPHDDNEAERLGEEIRNEVQRQMERNVAKSSTVAVSQQDCTEDAAPQPVPTTAATDAAKPFGHLFEPGNRYEENTTCREYETTGDSITEYDDGLDQKYRDIIQASSDPEEFESLLAQHHSNVTDCQKKNLKCLYTLLATDKHRLLFRNRLELIQDIASRPLPQEKEGTKQAENPTVRKVRKYLETGTGRVPDDEQWRISSAVIRYNLKKPPKWNFPVVYTVVASMKYLRDCTSQKETYSKEVLLRHPNQTAASPRETSNSLYLDPIFIDFSSEDDENEFELYDESEFELYDSEEHSVYSSDDDEDEYWPHRPYKKLVESSKTAVPSVVPSATAKKQASLVDPASAPDKKDQEIPQGDTSERLQSAFEMGKPAQGLPQTGADSSDGGGSGGNSQPNESRKRGFEQSAASTLPHDPVAKTSSIFSNQVHATRSEAAGKSLDCVKSLPSETTNNTDPPRNGRSSSIAEATQPEVHKGGTAAGSSSANNPTTSAGHDFTASPVAVEHSTPSQNGISTFLHNSEDESKIANPHEPTLHPNDTVGVLLGNLHHNIQVGIQVELDHPDGENTHFEKALDILRYIQTLKESRTSERGIKRKATEPLEEAPKRIPASTVHLSTLCVGNDGVREQSPGHPGLNGDVNNLTRTGDVEKDDKTF